MEFLTQSDGVVALIFAFLGSGLAAVLGAVFLRHHLRGGKREKTVKPPRLTTPLAGGFSFLRPVDDVNAGGVSAPAEALAQTTDQPMWLRRLSGRVLWSNVAYDTLCAANEWQDAPDAMTAPKLPSVLNCYAEAQGGRRHLRAYWDNQDRHFEVCETQVGDGQVFGIANDVTARATVEARLQQFIASLAETFAHVPIGLAIFDERNRLTMFNPALSDLLSLDPAQLARNPEIRDVFDMLRAVQTMPEERSLKERRRVVKEIIDAARGDGWQADWVLSDQRTIRVNGRAHPNNSVAFLFEDVTKTASLEQKYRGEIDLFHATFDRLDEAVVIFGPSGQLLRANFAFHAMWPQTNGPEHALRDVTAITGLCASSCAPNPAWEKLCSFVTSGQSRATWDATFDVLGGGRLHGRFAPLPDGSTLALFSQLRDHIGQAGIKSERHKRDGLPRAIGQAPIRWPDPMPSDAEAQAVRILANALVLNDDSPPQYPIKVDRLDGKLRLTAPRSVGDTGTVLVGDDPMAFRIFRRVAQSHGMIADRGPDGAIDLRSSLEDMISEAS